MKGTQRLKRLRKLKRWVGARVASHFFAAGILPSMDYGAAINGISDSEWNTM